MRSHMPIVSLIIRNNVLSTRHTVFSRLHLHLDHISTFLFGWTRTTEMVLTALIRKLDMLLDVRLTDCRSVHLNTPLKVPDAQ